MKPFLSDLMLNEQCVSDQDIATYMNNSDKFGGAFVINMETKPERLIEAGKTLQKVGLDWTRFKAISGAKLLQEKARYNFDMSAFFSRLRPGEMGCLLSHLTIINLASQHPNQNNFTMIFEDDIITSTNSIQDTLDRIANIDGRESIDLVYFGKCLECCTRMTHIEDNIWRAVAPSCCHAYAIKNSFAKKLMIDIEECNFGAPNCDYFNHGIDTILIKYTVNVEANTIVVHPSIFMQDILTTASDLRPDFLHNYLECQDIVGLGLSEHNNPENEDVKGGPDWLKIVLFVIVGIVLIVLLTKFMTKHRKISLCITIVVLLIYIILLTRYFAKKFRECPHSPPINKDGRMTIESFTAPNLTSPSTSQHFEIDSSNLLTKDYKAFNPNAIVKNGQIVTAFRVSNGKSSYPLIEVFDSDLNVIQSKRVVIKSDHKILDYDRFLGFEDARIFEHNGDIALIGVNLDRNEVNIPAMVVLKLDHNFEVQNAIHLNYPPVANRPNKNWSPISLSGNRLGYIVNVDPLLIVTQIDETGLCEKVIEKSTNLPISPVSNSSVTLIGEKIPKAYQDVLKITEPQNEFFMLLHSKYIEGKFVKDGKLIQYQHYLAIVNPYKGTVRMSKPFHVEESNRPHIEYVSGFYFQPEGDLIITYGLRDEEAKFFPLSAKNMTILF